MKHREIKELSQCHTANKRWSYKMNPESMFLISGAVEVQLAGRIWCADTHLFVLAFVTLLQKTEEFAFTWEKIQYTSRVLS